MDEADQATVDMAAGLERAQLLVDAARDVLSGRDQMPSERFAAAEPTPERAC